MIILLDRKGSESSLPDVTARFIVTMVSSDVGSHQPLHPSAEIAIIVWVKYQVEMIGHQAEADQSHGQTLTGLANEFQESLIIFRLVKHIIPRIPTINDMVNNISNRGSSRSRHRLSISEPKRDWLTAQNED
jgi:hypothetical protein